MNRAPGKGDTWWATHEAGCGGTYTKIQEPAMTKKQLDALSAKERAGETSKGAVRKRKASILVVEDVIENDGSTSDHKRSRAHGEDGTLVVDQMVMVQCPICNKSIAEIQINEHLDVVHLS
jgi:hypothetical protein